MSSPPRKETEPSEGQPVGDGLPMLTIGLPMRDAESTLPAALASIRNQSFGDWELLIVDDGSGDRSPEIAAVLAKQDGRVRLMHDGEQRGLPTRLNQLLELARGRFFARMDADDVAYRDRLERQVAFLVAHPDVDVVGSSMLVFGAGGEPRGKRTAPPTHEQIVARAGLRFFPLFHPTWVGRTDWFRQYGYRPTAQRCEDQDLLLRARRKSRFANVPEILLGYREDKVRLRRTLVGRAYWARNMWGARHDESRLAALAAVGAQSAKGAVELAAVALRAQHRLLPHRARPITDAERQQWAKVWASVQPGARDRGAVPARHEPS